MEPKISEKPPFIPNPYLCRIPPLIPIEYPKQSQAKKGMHPSVKVETGNDINETLASKRTDNSPSSSDISSTEDIHLKKKFLIQKLEEIKRELIEEEFGGSNPENLGASNDSTARMRQYSTLVQERGLVQGSNIGMNKETMSEKVSYFSTNFCLSRYIIKSNCTLCQRYSLLIVFQDETFSDEELEFKVVVDGDSLEHERMYHDDFQF